MIKMLDYLIIVEILSDVLNGQNLTESFKQHIITAEKINVGRIKDISYGVLRNYNILKCIIDKLVHKKPDIEIEIVLLIAIYELKFSKKPHFATVNEIVNLTFRLSGKQSFKSFVNAVVRNYLRTSNELEQSIKSDEFKFNCPKWLIEKLKIDHPKEYINIINTQNQKPKLGIRVNNKKTSLAEYIEVLKEYEINHVLIENKIIITDSITMDNLPGFETGAVSVQNISAQKLTDLVKLNPGEYVLDACSAPGGKTCQILENNEVNLIAQDIDDARLVKVKQNLTRLDLSAKLVVADASKIDWWDGKLFDTVIADVPCSASGTIKRNPDIKIQRQANDINNFVNTQRKIIENLWQVVKPGGQLVYITCSIFKEENSLNTKYFTNKFKDMQITSELEILPTEYADGFYYCIIQKQG